VFAEAADFRPDPERAHEQLTERLSAFSGPVAEALATVTDPSAVVYSRTSQMTVGLTHALAVRASRHATPARCFHGSTAIPSSSTSACSSQSLTAPMTAIAG
jgi:hypothetical protein